MEKKFYTDDDFEQLLKENADKFRMYPSKRVWHGIYNDLHPSRRWPSLAIWLLLITSMVFVGISNKSNISRSNDSKNIASDNVPSNTVLAALHTTNQKDQQDKLINNPQGFTNNGNSKADTKIKRSDRGTGKKLSIPQMPDLNSDNDEYLSTSGQKTSPVTIAMLKTDNAREQENTNAEINTVFNTDAVTDVVSQSKKMTVSINGISSENNDITVKSTIEPEAKAKKADAEVGKSSVVTNINNDKAWIEDYAFHNRASLSKWKTRVSYEVYFTPSVGYRTLSKNSIISPSSALVATNGNVDDFKKALSQAAAINIELGGNLLYSVAKNWNLKAGIQVNYTNYRVNAYELKHPTMTTLALNDLNSGMPILSPRSTTLANNSGLSSKKLNNNTYQISIPLGADIKIAGKNNLKWYAGATIQPTFIVGGNAYLISSDLKNYVTDNSFMRKMNLNAGIESFISYKTKSGIIVNAGPQFRYQLFSTYNRQYTYNEKLYNLGLKIGIITKF